MNTPVCPRLKELGKTKSTRSAELRRRLQMLYPNAECALEFGGDPFRLLVMARLSAQCTDQRVNLISPALFAAYPDAASLACAEQADLERLIFSTGMYREKARQLIAMAQKLIDTFGGAVPSTKEELLTLPGVGTKIANLMLGDVFGKPEIVADTHMIRLAGRFALCDSKNQHKVEAALDKLIPKAEQSDFCHRAVLFGRQFCKAQRPDCACCQLFDSEDL